MCDKTCCLARQLTFHSFPQLVALLQFIFVTTSSSSSILLLLLLSLALCGFSGYFFSSSGGRKSVYSTNYTLSDDYDKFFSIALESPHCFLLNLVCLPHRICAVSRQSTFVAGVTHSDCVCVMENLCVRKSKSSLSLGMTN